ncbi:MAG: SPFH domain-containing protein, partial [Ilumatobacteraceae bacterium]
MFPIFSVKQGTVAVITTWGRYKRLVRPGLGFRIPFAQKIHSRVSIQHQSMELSFQAIT